jgi:DNA-binding GntR family transcriptional regulator
VGQGAPPPPPPPPPRAGALPERAYTAIRDAIQDNTLGSGRRVPELELCAWLKMSRTPVREALRRLQSEGMLEHGQGGGLSVVRLDLRAVTELYDLRESLEGTAASLAARGADATEIRVLQATVEAHRRLPDDPKVHARENTLFHQQIYRAAHNRFLLKSLQNLHDSVALLGRTTFAAPGRILESINEHQAIVDAIVRRDEAQAEVHARQHVRRGYELRIEALTAAQADTHGRFDQSPWPGQSPRP